MGPNGAMLYCLEYLEKNVDWLVERLRGLKQKYLVFDFPGQVRNVQTVQYCDSGQSNSVTASIGARNSPNAGDTM